MDVESEAPFLPHCPTPGPRRCAAVIPPATTPASGAQRVSPTTGTTGAAIAANCSRIWWARPLPSFLWGEGEGPCCSGRQAHGKEKLVLECCLAVMIMLIVCHHMALGT